MKFSTSALAAAIVATTVNQSPASVHAWSTGSHMIGPFCASPMMLSSPAVELLRRQQAMINRAYQLESQQQQNKQRREGLSSLFPSSSSTSTTMSPRYEIIDEDHQLQIAVDVPGVKMEDIDVSLEDNMLTIRGHRYIPGVAPPAFSTEGDDGSSTVVSRSVTSSHTFLQRFALKDPTIDVDKLTAHLENGVLLVTAPKDVKRIEDNIRKIPITKASSSSSGVAITPPPSQGGDVLDLDDVDISSQSQEDESTKDKETLDKIESKSIGVHEDDARIPEDTEDPELTTNP